MPNELDRSLLEAALTGLEAQKARVEEHISAVRSQLGIRGPGRPKQTEAETEPPTPARKKRRMSAAGRRAISEATKKRWAAVRAAEGSASGSCTQEAADVSSSEEADCGGSEEAVGCIPGCERGFR